jgi:hypothetical protein
VRRQEPRARLFISFALVIYLAGVGIALAPTIRDKWNTTAADLTASVAQELPKALAWPVRAYRSLPQTPKN